MFGRTVRSALACMLLSACATATPAEIVPDVPRLLSAEDIGLSDSSEATDLPVSDVSGRERFRFVDEHEQGLKSVLLVPTVVDTVVAAGPLARSQVFVGALFATQRIGSDRVAGVGLVVRAVGGGLGPTLSVLPMVALTVDGQEVQRSSVARTGLYHVQRGPFGPEETLMFRVRPETLEAMAGGKEVEVLLGSSMMMRLDDVQIANLGDFLEQIPEDTRFDLRHELGTSTVWRTQ